MGTKVNARPILLDITRLMSRLGKGPPTGIDRVEAEWLAYLQGQPHLLLRRHRRMQHIYRPEAGAEVLAALGWTGGQFVVRSTASGDPATPELDLSAHVSGRGGPHGWGLRRRLAKWLPKAVGLQVGHSNLDEGLWRNLGIPGAVYIHDVIPLDFPQFTRPDQGAVFVRKFYAAMAANLILTISEYSAARIEEWQERLGTARPPVVASHIGTRLTQPNYDLVPGDIPLDQPYFLTIGTIEPRKNHALLLEAWALMPEPRPNLIIVGRRGWLNEDVFATLDTRPDGIFEYAGLDDRVVAALIEKAHGLLMPSHAEGFGMPMAEAAVRSVPVLTADLPTATEILGDYTVQLPSDPGIWAQTITRMSAAAPSRRKSIPVPAWGDHFLDAHDAIDSYIR